MVTNSLATKKKEIATLVLNFYQRISQVKEHGYVFRRLVAQHELFQLLEKKYTWLYVKNNKVLCVL